MKVNGVSYRTIEEIEGERAVRVIDQTLLPNRLEHVRLETLAQAATAISTMIVRGAPLIGVAAAYGLALALRDDPSDAGLARAVDTLLRTRPTAVNIRTALDAVVPTLRALPPAARSEAAWLAAREMAEADVRVCEAIGRHGAELLGRLPGNAAGPERLNIMTHCNAGWLATVDWGTALAPVYRLHDMGVNVHVWVSETRPRNQGMLTAWELGSHGVPFTLFVDNAAGHLIQNGLVDACIVGTDRVTRTGDVCNKIGTFLKALAASNSDVPFYVGAPSSSVDWELEDGTAIPIEERGATEVCDDPDVAVTNPGFDVTPARLVSALITERGVCEASERGLAGLFPERARSWAGGAAAQVSR